MRSDLRHHNLIRIAASSLALACATAFSWVSATALPANADPIANTPSASGSVSGSARSGCATVHMGPAPSGVGSPSGYLQLKLAGGSQSTQAVVLANPEAYPCTVNLAAAYGKTAVNTGDTYVSAGGSNTPCALESCWLSRLPPAVTLGANSRVTVPFTIKVPAGTSSGQYLAGIIATPAIPVGSSSSTSAGNVSATIQTSVGIGVAITVPGPLNPSLQITSVKVTSSPDHYSAVQIAESNNGNTWEHASGVLLVNINSHQEKFQLTSGTVLPKEQATLSVTTDIPKGNHPSEIDLWYANHTKEAVWKGTLDFPAIPTVKTQNGVRTVILPSAAIPVWVVALLVAFGTLVGVGLVFFLFTLRRSRKARRGRHFSGARN